MKSSLKQLEPDADKLLSLDVEDLAGIQTLCRSGTSRSLAIDCEFAMSSCDRFAIGVSAKMRIGALSVTR
jgi:hypothetical protein